MDNKLEGKTIIVTGGNCGIGYATALGLAQQGARVIIACRDETKGKEALEKLKTESKNENIELELLDLASFKSIKDFSDRIKAKLTRLDILINNAGLVKTVYQKTEDGFETTFGVNYLGPYNLTRLLLDLIKQSAPSRIVNVSSGAHKGIKMNWDDLQLENSFSAIYAYRQSKLGNILFTIELAERLKGTGVTVVSLHPGAVNTEIIRTDATTSFGARLLAGISRPLMALFGKNLTQGAATSIHCAIDEEVPNHSGSYYDNCRVTQASAEAQNLESAKKLWSISSNLCGLDD